MTAEDTDRLRAEIAQHESALAELRSQLAAAAERETDDTGHALPPRQDWKWPLTEDEYERYSRQMIVPNFGLQGTPPPLPLSPRACLVSTTYKRLIIHQQASSGCATARCSSSAQAAWAVPLPRTSPARASVCWGSSTGTRWKCRTCTGRWRTQPAALNPSITYHAHATQLTPQNAASILRAYDLVLDCTDHPAARYLISDACVLLRKPLVSASAFQTAGQLLRLNSPVGRGPCYRCVFPRPPPPESVVGCGEGGVVGPVVGVMGVLSMADTMFRTVRIRGRRDDCVACSATEGALTLAQMQSSLDYVQFCGVAQPVRLLGPAERIAAAEYARIAANRAASPHLLIDVRDKEHFDLSSIPGSVNVPIRQFMRPAPADAPEAAPDWMPADLPHSAPIYVVCRVGNDSQVAAQKLKELGLDREGERFVGDIDGGLRAWRKDVDPTLPFV
ncbi:molybdenum cofactor biosynthetic protein (CnxF), putative [Cordyceps militaris CM01]|uniref:Molybdenum cofactor biosynthetic protein (CnxF), putative n=1 Tax=Cordyceps militaris (strain CM01) TaxID=983644 RepID=G3JBB9_CORMM|nr:molybdenum cofactor biosynthetic protein (CnxF), putative [Cordyceps militaris CM01]EGX95277.1 molybdenum cofactor biosynthetic protein (CnxF), putative [Cordyceps militaris CM01]